MINIDELIDAVSKGVSEHCGCADGQDERTLEWQNLAKSDNPQDHALLIDQIENAVAYG